MDVDLVDETAQQTHFNGAVPLERARTELTKANPDAGQLQRRKEAEKAYGRGRKIPGMLFEVSI
jgi:U3 small nucleolar RNA-associated protein 7